MYENKCFLRCYHPLPFKNNFNPPPRDTSIGLYKKTRKEEKRVPFTLLPCQPVSESASSYHRETRNNLYNTTRTEHISHKVLRTHPISNQTPSYHRKIPYHPVQDNTKTNSTSGNTLSLYLKPNVSSPLRKPISPPPLISKVKTLS